MIKTQIFLHFYSILSCPQILKHNRKLNLLPTLTTWPHLKKLKCSIQNEVNYGKSYIYIKHNHIIYIMDTIYIHINDCILLPLATNTPFWYWRNEIWSKVVFFVYWKRLAILTFILCLDKFIMERNSAT